jgi:galactose mutarotase-like enzyme
MLEVRYIFNVENRPVNEYTIKNGGYQISVLNLGAALTKIIVPNKDNKLENITLRYYDYKLYKTNPYYLGSLIDMKEIEQGKPDLLNYYFKCQVLENSLVFTYRDLGAYISVIYTLIDNFVIIEYDNNMKLELGQIIYFNLSGNIKTDILQHQLTVNNFVLNPKKAIESFYKFTCNQDTEIVLSLNTNKIKCVVNLFTKALYYNFGKLFTESLYLNKKIPAQEYSAIGIAIESKTAQFRFN